MCSRAGHLSRLKNINMPSTRKLTGSRCRCGACHEHFNSTGAFDAHRKGPYTARRCLTSTEMAERGMVRNAAGFMTTGARPAFHCKVAA